jgi:hypothetical protein
LIFTCVVGIIELLSQFKGFGDKKLDEKSLLTFLYWCLVVGILLSLSQCWGIYRISHAITHSGKLGEELLNFALKTPSLIDKLEIAIGFLTLLWWEILVETSVLVFFFLLYLAKVEGS